VKYGFDLKALISGNATDDADGDDVSNGDQACDGLGSSISAANYKAGLGHGIVIAGLADDALFEKLDPFIRNALRVGLTPVITYNPADKDMTASAQRQAFLDWWDVTAEHYKFYSHKVGSISSSTSRDSPLQTRPTPMLPTPISPLPCNIRSAPTFSFVRLRSKANPMIWIILSSSPRLRAMRWSNGSLGPRARAMRPVIQTSGLQTCPQKRPTSPRR